jgi:hypothetical protein
VITWDRNASLRGYQGINDSLRGYQGMNVSLRGYQGMNDSLRGYQGMYTIRSLEENDKYGYYYLR